MQKQSFWQLREFWTLVTDLVVSTALYFGGKYAAPAVLEDIKWGILALQPVAAFFVVYFAEERREERAEARAAEAFANTERMLSQLKK